MRVLGKASVLVALALLLVAGPASATLMAIGDPEETGSWTARFQEDVWYGGVHYNFNHFQEYIVSDGGGGPLETPFQIAFSDGNPWTTGVTGQTQWATAHAPVGYVQWTFDFDGSSSYPITVNSSVWVGTQEVGSSNLTWGPGWSYPERPLNQSYVPEPISMVMLGCLGAGMAAARKLRRRA